MIIIQNLTPKSDVDGEADEEGAGAGGAVDVAGVAQGALVEVVLVGVENVLEAGGFESRPHRQRREENK